MGDEDETYDIIKMSLEFADELPTKYLIIGDEYGYDFILLNSMGVYLWDEAENVSTTTEDNNVHKLAETFTEFLKKLEYNTLQ